MKWLHTGELGKIKSHLESIELFMFIKNNFSSKQSRQVYKKEEKDHELKKENAKKKLLDLKKLKDDCIITQKEYDKQQLSKKGTFSTLTSL